MSSINKPESEGYYWTRCNHPDAPDWRQKWHMIHVRNNLGYLQSKTIGREDSNYIKLDHLILQGGTWYFKEVEKPSAPDPERKNPISSLGDS